MKPLPKLLVDLGPLVAFFLAYSRWDIMMATGVLMAATVAALAATYAVERRIPRMPLITAGLIMVFGGLTLALSDETFIKLKPTFVYLLFAAVLLAGHLTGRAFLKSLFEMAFRLREEGWRRLTLRWILFFVALAALNEVVWRTMPTDVWVQVKVFGFLPLTLLFALAQLPLIRRTTIPDEPAAQE